MTERTCAVENCSGRVAVRGFCSGHYHRLRRYGSPTGQPAPRQRAPAKPCSVEGCELPARGRYCSRHTQRLYRTGSLGPAETQRPTYGTGVHRHGDGYVQIVQPGHPLADSRGRVMEHRWMAWEAGMFSDPELEVHHRNEVKDDNRLDNFEILTKPEHASRHAHERGTITNQFGTFPVRAPYQP